MNEAYKRDFEDLGYLAFEIAKGGANALREFERKWENMKERIRHENEERKWNELTAAIKSLKTCPKCHS